MTQRLPQARRWLLSSLWGFQNTWNYLTWQTTRVTLIRLSLWLFILTWKIVWFIFVTNVCNHSEGCWTDCTGPTPTCAHCGPLWEGRRLTELGSRLGPSLMCLQAHKSCVIKTVLWRLDKVHILDPLLAIKPLEFPFLILFLKIFQKWLLGQWNFSRRPALLWWYFCSIRN